VSFDGTTARRSLDFALPPTHRSKYQLGVFGRKIDIVKGCDCCRVATDNT